MKSYLLRVVPLKRDEWRLVVPLLTLLALNTMVFELSDVVATAGFVSHAGPEQLPWLWLLDNIVTLVLSGVYALVVDRMARVHLVGWLLGGFAAVYLLIQMMFTYGAPESLNYLLLYILADQQFIIFPLAFWALTNDIYTIAESKRLFPIIGVGYGLGSVVGNALGAGSAVWLARLGKSPSELLGLCAVVCLVGLGLLRLTFYKREVRARQSKGEGVQVRETFEVGMDFFKNVPLFRYLALSGMLLAFCFLMIRYHFFSVLNQSFTTDLEFQAFYGVYNLAYIVVILLLQWLVVGRLIERLELRSTFVVLPLVSVFVVGSSLVVPGLWGATVGPFISWVIERAWNEPVRKSVQGLVPDERRGRISAFLDSYLFAVAAIVGCLFLGGLLVATSLLGTTPQFVVRVYLTAGILAASGALWAAVQLYMVYEKSLLNWRLARSRRKSVLDGIDF